MSNETDVTVILPPPAIPLRILSDPAPEPVPRPQGYNGSDLTQKKKKERRMELQGLEVGDPRSTINLLKLGLHNVAQSLPPILRKYGWMIPIILVIWTGLGTFSAYKMMAAAPALAPLWMFLDKIILVLVFLTASYNNFIGKAIYATVVLRVIVPLVRRVRREGFRKVKTNFTSLIPDLQKNWAEVGARSLGILILFAGLAAMISNFLTRNNAIDKIAVSLAIAFAIMKALGDGPRSIPFMTGRVVMNDLFVLLRKPSPVRNHHIYVALSGLTLGFLSSILLAVLRKPLGENIGYILGAIAVVAGLVLIVVMKSKQADA
ncbi:hypothetical protein LPY66_07555 [Dehalobacter sp. DCM]|uniref:hypothetical protein n=1 Tax=Dehalobacter sp. DCM TaxID=2907827 RepID=UPI003081E9AB|nr:hypothetical protein LPY66_07555 [Dehalobacter sp. DCM]